MDGCNSCGKINSTNLEEEMTVDAQNYIRFRADASLIS